MHQRVCNYLLDSVSNLYGQEEFASVYCVGSRHGSRAAQKRPKTAKIDLFIHFENAWSRREMAGPGKKNDEIFLFRHLFSVTNFGIK